MITTTVLDVPTLAAPMSAVLMPVALTLDAPPLVALSLNAPPLVALSLAAPTITAPRAPLHFLVRRQHHALRLG